MQLTCNTEQLLSACSQASGWGIEINKARSCHLQEKLAVPQRLTVGKGGRWLNQHAHLHYLG